MRSCSSSPSGQGWLASPPESALCPQPGSWGPQSRELGCSWHRSRLWKIQEEIRGRDSGRRSHPGLQAAQPQPPAQPGAPQLPVHLRDQFRSPSETQPRAADGNPGQRGSSWSWQTKHNAPGTDRARGSLEKLPSEDPSLPEPMF